MRIIRIRHGFNPNSSSLSVNMTAILAATGIVSLGTYLVSAATLLFARAKRESPPPASRVAASESPAPGAPPAPPPGGTAQG